MDAAAHLSLCEVSAPHLAQTWPTVAGVVIPGHGVASGQARDSPFPAGTIALQAPHFRERGLDLDSFYPGTINIDISPARLEVRAPHVTFADVEWTDVHKAETFSFAHARLRHQGREVEGLIYWPHPETKPMFHQAGGVVEVLMPRIENLAYGDDVVLAVNPDQVRIHPLP